THNVSSAKSECDAFQAYAQSYEYGSAAYRRLLAAPHAIHCTEMKMLASARYLMAGIEIKENPVRPAPGILSNPESIQSYFYMLVFQRIIGLNPSHAENPPLVPLCGGRKKSKSVCCMLVGASRACKNRK